jgi:succinyl-diaminopimelate desuccinylase
MVDQDIQVPSLAFVCDEETGGENGILQLLAGRLIAPCDCVVAEPCPARHPSIGQKGLCRIEMNFAGTPAHGSLYPAVGTSAIMEAMSFLDRIKDLHERDYPANEQLEKIISQSSDVLGKEFSIPGVSRILQKITFNPGVIRGGEKSNVVAQACSLDLELRIPWGCSITDLLAEIGNYSTRGTIVSSSTHEPSITDPSSLIASVTCNEVEKVYGGEVYPIVQWAASDARHLRKSGYRVIEYGPGEISTLHAVNERVRIQSLENAVRIYEGIIKAYT